MFISRTSLLLGSVAILFLLSGNVLLSQTSQQSTQTVSWLRQTNGQEPRQRVRELCHCLVPAS